MAVNGYRLVARVLSLTLSIHAYSIGIRSAPARCRWVGPASTLQMASPMAATAGSASVLGVERAKEGRRRP